MRKIWIVVVLALIVRVAIMPIGIHSDIKAYNLAAFLIAQKGELFSFYDYIARLPRTDPLVGLHGDGQFNYPPLAYLSHALFNLVLGPIYPWEAFDRLIYDFDNFRGSTNSGVLLVLLKLPYLVADLAGLWLILKLFENKKEKLLAAIFWLFNPFTLYSTYLMGQFDIFIAVLILAATYFKNPIFLGLAAGFKPFPLVLLPFLPGNKIKNILIGLATYAVLLAPYLGSTAFKHYALFAEQSDKPFYAKIMVSGSQYLPLFAVGLVVAGWLFWYRPKLLDDYEWLSVPLLLFFSLTHFHPQWFTWVVPLLVLTAVKKRSSWPILGVITICYILIVFSFDSSLHLGLLASTAQSGILINDTLVSIVRGVFAGSALMLLWL